MIGFESVNFICVQEIQGLWKEVEADVKLKKSTITELNLKLTETEKQRTDQVRLSVTDAKTLLKCYPKKPSDTHSLWLNNRGQYCTVVVSSICKIFIINFFKLFFSYGGTYSFDVLKTGIGCTSLNLFRILTNPNIDKYGYKLKYIHSLKSFNKCC